MELLWRKCDILVPKWNCFGRNVTILFHNGIVVEEM
jgi:hypothetical protein